MSIPLRQNIGVIGCSNSGFSTIELLLAFTIGMLFLTAALILIVNQPGGGQQFRLNNSQEVTFDTTLDSGGINSIEQNLASTTAALEINWHTRFLSTIRIDQGYAQNPPTIVDISPCLKLVTVDVLWTSLGSRAREQKLSTLKSNTREAKALGGDCDALPLTHTWTRPRLVGSTTLSTTTPLALDILAPFAYLTDSAGLLKIAPLAGAASSSFLSSDYNTGTTVFDLDVARQTNPITGEERTYVFAARNSTTSQFQVIDVTDPLTPVSLPAMTMTFGGSNPPRGSFPQGWRLAYYDNKVYALSRETAGYELHIFDVSTPSTPRELGPGFEVNGTANDLVVTSVLVSGTKHTLVFLATERSTNEIMVINVTNPTIPTLLTSVDIPTTQDALSVYVVGNSLYVGRQRTVAGPELLRYDLTYPSEVPLGLTVTPVGPGGEVGADVTSIRVSEDVAFITTSTLGDSFQIFNVPALGGAMTRHDTTPLRLSGRMPALLDYSFPYMYLGGDTPAGVHIVSAVP